MKLNKKTLAAINPANQTAKAVAPNKAKGVKVSIVKPAAKAKTSKAKTGKVAKQAKPIISKGFSLALMQGKRSAGANGGCLRRVELATQDGLTLIRATQDSAGLTVDGTYCPVIGGFLRGTRQAQLELGGYANGGKYGSKGCKVTLLTDKQWLAMSKPASIRYTKDGATYKGRAAGDAAQTGILACLIPAGTYGAGQKQAHAWQVEQDKWAGANEHEQGKVTFGK